MLEIDSLSLFFNMITNRLSVGEEDRLPCQSALAIKWRELKLSQKLIV